VATIDTGRCDEIASFGFEVIRLRWDRWSQSPIAFALAIIEVVAILRARRPDLVHAVGPKPVVVGSLAGRLFRRTAVVNSVSGQGMAGAEGTTSKIARRLLRVLYRLALRNPRALTVFQNRGDLHAFVDAGLVRPASCRLVRGSGVDPQQFSPPPVEPRDDIVLLACRLIWEKGVGEFVEMAVSWPGSRSARFVIAGAPDDGNPRSVPEATLREWVGKGYIEWWGFRSDMAAVLRQASIVVLPTYYGEGLPKVLLEAAACGRAIVASDLPPCRELVDDGFTGVLVPPRDPQALTRAVMDLLNTPELRSQMGSAARQRVVEEFNLQLIVELMLSVYAEAERVATHRG
jgi:glycosyltransferase involved in cell wall biosynthesis